MGCGAVCGNNSSISQQNVFEQKILLTLIPQIKHRKQFIPTNQFTLMMKTIRQDPIKYKLKVPNKLIAGEDIDPNILTKWRVILYCMDTDSEHFKNCLGQNLLRMGKKNSLKINNSSSVNRQNNINNGSDETAVGNLEIQQLEGDMEQDEQQQQEWQQHQYTLSQSRSLPILPHKQFTQIEKDINRTCDLPSSKKPLFQRILKRLTNYFPKMGYTQGINFIIGYLLMIGLGEFDVFWMFVHIAISRRYLLLGLFEDKFPLSDIYKHVFKNILRRVNLQLYQHLYEDLKMNQSVWVFKWFFTYFIYSFPFQMIKYVFDVVIQIGGLGLVKFAIAITQELAEVLMEEHDQCEISIFFQSLRDIQTFNQYVSISKVVERVYSLQIKKQDFEGIRQEDGDNFYKQYIIANLQSVGNSNNGNNYSGELKVENTTGGKVESKDEKNINQTQEGNQRQGLSNKLLKQWYEKLLMERTLFVANKTTTTKPQISSALAKPNQPTTLQPSDQLIHKKPTQRTSLQTQLHLLTTIPQPSPQPTHPQPLPDQSTTSNKASSIKDSIQIKKNSSIPSTGYSSYNQKDHASRLNGGDDVSEIDELWDQEDGNSSVSRNNVSSKISQQSRTQSGFNVKGKKTQYEDELDKFASTHCNPLNKSKYNNPLFNKTSSIFNNDQKPTSYRPKINNFQIPSSDRSKVVGHLMKAGQNIIVSNLSIDGCAIYQSSNNSQYSKVSQKQKKSKESDLYRRDELKNKMKKQVSLTHHNHNNNQNKPSQQDISKLSANNSNSHRLQSQQDCNSSSIESFIDPQNSFCASQENELGKDNNEAFSVRGVESYRVGRTITHEDSINNYLHSSNIKMAKSRDVMEYNASEIELFQPPQQVFKKKNRVSFRVDGVQKQGATQVLRTKLSHVTTSNAHIPNKTIQSVKFGIEQSINYEQSYQSIFVPSEGQKENTFRFQQQLQKCQIESVK